MKESGLQSKGFVDLFATLASVEQISLNVITNSEQRAAGRVGRGVLAVGARHTTGEGTWIEGMSTRAK